MDLSAQVRQPKSQGIRREFKKVAKAKKGHHRQCRLSAQGYISGVQCSIAIEDDRAIAEEADSPAVDAALPEGSRAISK